MKQGDMEAAGEEVEKVQAGHEEQEGQEGLPRVVLGALEREGVLQELRTHLRGHIVRLLTSVRTGEPLPCKELFTQRLELTFQALNILIAEYLLRQEFSYALSVFVSEIPLANMVFQFAKTLMDSARLQESTDDIRFMENDIWHVLHSLGMQCDSEHATKIVQMYNGNSEKPPLLLCILKSVPLYRGLSAHVDDDTDRSIASNKSIEDDSGTHGDASPDRRVGCKHVAYCEPCKIGRKSEREMYKRKKKNLVKDLSYYINLDPGGNGADHDLLKEISLLEKSIIDEMFQQLKSVYESEMQMWRSKHGEKVKQTLAVGEMHVQKRLEELENDYTSRRQELEESIQHRKRFLWELAQSMKRQHVSLNEAMQKVKEEGRKLNVREQNIKDQLRSAEEVLKRNGEQMREQLSNELKILEKHIDTMKIERDTIMQERSRLEKLKTELPNQSDEAKVEFEDQKRKHDELQRHYDIMKDELLIVKKYIATTKFLEPKCTVEVNTMTDICGLNYNLSVALNNDDARSKYVMEEVIKNNQPEERNVDSDEKKLQGSKSEIILNDKERRNNAGLANMTKNQLINDLKHFKNVNFRNNAIIQTNVEEHPTFALKSQSSAETVVQNDQNEKLLRDLLAQLQQDNSQLRTFANQQQDHIKDLVTGQGKLSAELSAARHTIDNMTRMAAITARQRYNASREHSPTALGDSAGANEDSTPFPHTGPRVTPPLLRNFPSFPVTVANCSAKTRDERRTCPTFRRAPVPLSMHSQVFRARYPTVPIKPHHSVGAVKKDPPHLQAGSSKSAAFNATRKTERINQLGIPRSYGLKKADYMDKMEVEVDQALINEEISPTTEMLSTAKKRLRKLEIEAEAVEKSYIDFRKRHSGDFNNFKMEMSDIMNRENAIENLEREPQSVAYSQTNPIYGSHANNNINYDIKENYVKDEYKQYLKQYEQLLNHVDNKVSDIQNGIPFKDNVSNMHDTTAYKSKENLVEKSLTEFRKLYHDYKPSTDVHRSNEIQRSRERSQFITEKSLSPIFGLKSKSSEDLKLDSVKATIPKRPSTAVKTIPNKDIDDFREKIKDFKIDKLTNNTKHIEKAAKSKSKTKSKNLVPGFANISSFDKEERTHKLSSKYINESSKETSETKEKELLSELEASKEVSEMNSDYSAEKTMDMVLPMDAVVAKAENKTDLLQNYKGNSNKPLLCVEVEGIGIGDSNSETTRDKKSSSVLVLVESCMQEKISIVEDTSLKRFSAPIDKKHLIDALKSVAESTTSKNVNLKDIPNKNSPRQRTRPKSSTSPNPPSPINERNKSQSSSLSPKHKAQSPSMSPKRENHKSRSPHFSPKQGKRFRNPEIYPKHDKNKSRSPDMLSSKREGSKSLSPDFVQSPDLSPRRGNSKTQSPNAFLRYAKHSQSLNKEGRRGVIEPIFCEIQENHVDETVVDESIEKVVKSLDNADNNYYEENFLNDDFSNDVDNFIPSSRSEMSPISIAKISDDGFWD